MKENRVRVLVASAILSALAVVVVAVTRIPFNSFLDFEAKSVVIVMGGFIFGPAAAAAISFVAALIEMFLLSDTGIIGFVMNFLANAAFACSAALIYKKKHTISGAVVGLLTGIFSMTAVMLLWNYLLTPLYLHGPRAEVVKLLIPVFLPFNLSKGGMNAALSMLIYKPVVQGLRRAKLLPPSAGVRPGPKTGWLVTAASALAFSGALLIFLLTRSL